MIAHRVILMLFPVSEKSVGMKQHKRKLKRNARGRPRLRHKGQLIVMRLPPNELKALDRWMRTARCSLGSKQSAEFSASRLAKRPRRHREGGSFFFGF
jgi:hypothetical protein